MADLTSVISITGTINGRKVSITSECIYSGVVDAGLASADDHQLSDTIIGFNTSQPMTFAQDSPDYLMAVNSSPSETCVLEMANSGATVDHRMLLPAGAFVVLNQYQNGAGITKVSSGATDIDLEEISTAQIDTVDDIGFVCKGDLYVAFTSAS